MAIIELSRSLLGLENASTTEFGATDHPVVDLMKEWKKGKTVEKRDENTDLGGTMRLGAYDGLAPLLRVWCTNTCGSSHLFRAAKASTFHV